MCRLINVDAAHIDHILAAAVAAAQDRLHTCDQDLRTERFGNILIHAQIKALQLVALLASRRQHDDRHLRILADRLHNLPAVHLRHHHIQKNQRNVLLLEKQIHRLLAVSGFQHLIPFNRKEVLHQLPHPRLIVHDQYFNLIHKIFTSFILLCRV